MSAGVPGPTVVRDLVALESCRRQPSDRLVFHGILEVSVWFVAVTISMVTVQLRSLLQRERVTRQMGWLQSDGLLERSAPTLCRLTRQPIDQVQVDVDKSGRSSSFDCDTCSMSRRPTTDPYQFAVIHRLHAEANPIEPSVNEAAQSLLGHGSRMRFQGYLGLFLQFGAVSDLF